MTTVLAVLVLSLRGAAAIVVLTTLAGGVPRVVQAALAVTVGLWTALLVLPVRVIDPTLAAAITEVAVGGALGILAAVPLLAAQTAGRLVDLAGGRRGDGAYRVLFGVLAAAVFVGIDGHVHVITALVDSHLSGPSGGPGATGVLGALGALVPIAVRLAVPWLVTAAIVELAIGAGTRVAGRASIHAPVSAAVPAALVMMTASLVSLLAIAIAAAIRGAF